MRKTNKLLVGNPNQLEIDGATDDGSLSYLVMNIPFACNFACPKCYRDDNKSFDSITIETRKRVITQASDLGADVLCIAGEGEPLTNKRLTMNLLGHANSVGLKSILYSNASLLDESLVKELYDLDVTLITSLDSLDPSTYQSLTGYKDFDQVMKNLQTVRDVYKAGNKMRKDGLRETRWGLITIISQQNKLEIPQIKEYCGEDAFFICNYPINKGGAKSVWDSYVGTQNDMKELIKTANQYTDTFMAGLSAPTKYGQCIMLNNGVTIDTDGKTHACPAMVDTDLGSITDTSLEEIWQRTRDYAESKGNPACLAREIKGYCKKANVLSVGEMLV